MSLHQVFGDYGSGKTAFLAYQVKRLYLEHGEEMLEFSRAMIDRINATRKKRLSYPKKVPIYTNFKVEIEKSNGVKYSPYHIDGDEIGLAFPDSENTYKYFPPGSAIFIDEAQNYFNSKGDIKREVSAFFEKHRHNYLDIWFASQRGILINKDIRAITQDFKQIEELEHETSMFGTITKNRWWVKEFNDRFQFERFLASDGGEGAYITKVYENRGNIFDIYDSHCYMADYMPPEGASF